MDGEQARKQEIDGEQARKRARTDAEPSAGEDGEMPAGEDVTPAGVPSSAEMTASQIASMISEMLFAVRQGAPGMVREKCDCLHACCDVCVSIYMCRSDMCLCIHANYVSLQQDQMLKMCFNENVVVSSLSQRQQLVTGRDKVIGALVTGALIGKSKGLPQAEPIARVVAESVSSDAKDTLVSMALDVYAGGKSPFGVLAPQGGGGSLIVLRARRCQIDAMWVGDWYVARRNNANTQTHTHTRKHARTHTHEYT